MWLKKCTGNYVSCRRQCSKEKWLARDVPIELWCKVLSASWVRVLGSQVLQNPLAPTTTIACFKRKTPQERHLPQRNRERMLFVLFFFSSFFLFCSWLAETRIDHWTNKRVVDQINLVGSEKVSRPLPLRVQFLLKIDSGSRYPKDAGVTEFTPCAIIRAANRNRNNVCTIQWFDICSGHKTSQFEFLTLVTRSVFFLSFFCKTDLVTFWSPWQISQMPVVTNSNVTVTNLFQFLFRLKWFGMGEIWQNIPEGELYFCSLFGIRNGSKVGR